jgi:hypothetical protein
MLFSTKLLYTKVMESPDGATGENAADKLHSRPLLELEVKPQQKIDFFALDTFHPQAPRTNENYPLTPLVKKYVEQSEKSIRDNKTYQETIKDRDWQDKLFAFTKNHFTGRRAYYAASLGVTDITQLTPQQAIDLTLRMVLELTKYKDGDIAHNSDSSPEFGKPTQADQSTALQLLEDGSRNRLQDEWEGKGVCRNFAAMTRAVFEALKAKQQPENMLRNTYVLYNSGTEYAPKREKKLNFASFNPGHAWNSFVTIEPSGTAKSTIVDATWANIDYDTRKMVNIDHTRLRMEALVFEAALAFDTSTPRKDEQLQEILRYYMKNIVSPDSAGGHASANEIKLFFAKQVLRLGIAQKIRQFPQGINPLLGEIYAPLGAEMQALELAELWRINQRSEQPYNFAPVLANFAKDIELSNYHVYGLLVEDNKLQRMIVEAVRARPEFAKLLEDSPRFRARVRELPGIGLLPAQFRPRDSVADYNELIYLQDNSNELRNRIFFRSKARSLTDINPDNVKGIYTRARTILKGANASFYEGIEWMNDYDIVKDFDNLYKWAREEG